MKSWSILDLHSWSTGEPQFWCFGTSGKRGAMKGVWMSSAAHMVIFKGSDKRTIVIRHRKPVVAFLRGSFLFFWFWRKKKEVAAWPYSVLHLSSVVSLRFLFLKETSLKWYEHICTGKLLFWGREESRFHSHRPPISASVKKAAVARLAGVRAWLCLSGTDAHAALVGWAHPRLMPSRLSPKTKHGETVQATPGARWLPAPASEGEGKQTKKASPLCVISMMTREAAVAPHRLRCQELWCLRLSALAEPSSFNRFFFFFYSQSW